MGTNFQQLVIETAQKRLQQRPKTLNRQKTLLKLHVVGNILDLHASRANI
jgi:hypothetical protein